MPPRLLRRTAVGAALLALTAAPAGASAETTGGAQYGQSSQATAPVPAVPGVTTGGIDPSQPLPAPAPGTPVPAPRPGQVARIVAGGLAVAPAGAPVVVRQIVAAANRIALTRYVWGGGHARWEDRGYDCSGSVSYALHGGGLLNTPLDSTGLARYGQRGKGSWISVYGNPSHAYMIVAGLRFDTSNTRGDGPSWSRSLQSTSGSFTVRHPRGL